MFAPEPILFQVGSFIYRFASHTANFGYRASAWWIRHKDFDAIVARAERAGVDLGQKARWDLSVLHQAALRAQRVQAAAQRKEDADEP